MDRQQFEFLAVLGSIASFLLGVGLTLLVLSWLDEQYLFLLIMLVVLFFLVVSLRLSLFFRAYIAGARQLADELDIILTVNPDHRIKFTGPADMNYLADHINHFVDAFQELSNSQAIQIQWAKANLEGEKSRLMALMAELSEGVLVCNNEGRILLYNNQAKRLLGNNQTTSTHLGNWVSAGRSVFGLINRNVINHALEELTYRQEKQNSHLVSQFVTTTTNGQLIRVRITPILHHHQAEEETLNGFIMTLGDITQQSHSLNRRDRLLQSLTEGVRSSLANIRTAIETIEEYPKMDLLKLTELRRIIYNEALNLSTWLNQATIEYGADYKSDWQMEEMLVSDLLWAIQRRFEDKLEISTTVEAQEVNLWLKVDSYSIVQVMTYIMRRLKSDFGILEVTLRLKETDQLAAFDIVWQNGLVDMDTLWSWQNQSFIPASETTMAAQSALTLREVAEYHRGEVWCQADKIEGQAYFRLLLPATQTDPLSLSAANLSAVSKIVPANSRAEYYDKELDLFHQSEQTALLEPYPLTNLIYTVFDTETIGIGSIEGDEIISISATQIVNNRLRRHQIFDQLVNPQKPLPESSMAIHGISLDMLTNQPTIDQVLPEFFRFAQETVLVVYNAAFDMRLLQLKENLTGLKFTNPVLDPLLLSAIIHPDYDDHSLEAIAQRLGINVIGRHTSLGDAMLTGEVFIKLIPLLTEQGIVTLGQARQATEKIYYSRLNYLET